MENKIVGKNVKIRVVGRGVTNGREGRQESDLVCGIGGARRHYQQCAVASSLSIVEEPPGDAL